MSGVSSSDTRASGARASGARALRIVVRPALAFAVMCISATGLQGQTQRDSAGSAVPLVTAGFAEPKAQLDWRADHLLRGCETAFEHVLLTDPSAARKTTVASPANHASTSWNFFPPAAVEEGRRCYHRIGGDANLASYDLPVLLRLAVSINEDSLAQSVVQRQLALAAPSPRDRATVLENAIELLVHNYWGENSHIDHRTPAHDSMAFRFGAILDTIEPRAQVLAAQLRVMSALDKIAAGAGQVDTELVHARRFLALATSVPPSAVPAEDRAFVEGAIKAGKYMIADRMYVQTPTHENLTAMLAIRDAQMGPRSDKLVEWLLGRPAPALDGDFWFSLPAGTPGGTPTGTAPVIPAPGVVTLLVFLEGHEGTAPGALDEADALRRLHAQYPALQIVLVTMTRGRFQEQELRDNPAKEAKLIANYLTDVVKLPGTVCVIETKFHTEPGKTTVPIASPALNKYHLDPRDIDDKVFLIDAQGWVVQEGLLVLDGELIRRLLQR